METEEETARKALEMFCRAAEKETGDFWEIQQMENGDLAVVQTFKAAKGAMDDPKISDEEKKLMVTGVLFCMSSGGLVDLAKHLVLALSRGSLDLDRYFAPLSFLRGCASVEEMTVRLAACC